MLSSGIVGIEQRGAERKSQTVDGGAENVHILAAMYGSYIGYGMVQASRTAKVH